MISSNTEVILNFKDLEQLNIINYFKTINNQEFERTAALFIEEGELLAPFEKPIVGRKAIANYLSQEAKEMKLFPQRGKIQAIDNDLNQIDITGKVKTSLFTVNVGWDFTVNPQQKIIRTKIKLLASPQELLKLKKIKD